MLQPHPRRQNCRIHLKRRSNQNPQSRLPYAEWSGKTGDNLFAVPLEIIGVDDIGIVNNITSLISKEKNVSLRSIAIDSNDGLFQGRLVIGVGDTASLNNIVKKIATIKGVKDVRRSN